MPADDDLPPSRSATLTLEIELPPSFYMWEERILAVEHGQPVIVRPLGDLHVGSPYCHLDWLKADIQRILRNGDYWVGMGDYYQCDLKGTKHGGIYEQTMPPKQQREYVAQLLDPIRHLCLGAIAGNHDLRPHKDTGESPVAWMFKDLGLGDLFAPDCLMVQLAFGSRTSRLGRRVHGGGKPNRYALYLRHGTSMAASMGGKINHVMRSVEQVEADLYIVGHGHTPLTFGGMHVSPNPWGKRNAPILRPYRAMMSNSYQMMGGYAASAGLRTADMRQPRAILRSDCEVLTIEQ